MSTFRCPHCSVTLSEAELKEGWCDKCGKHVPEHLLSAAAKESREHRHEHLTHKQAPLPHAPEARPLETDKDLEPARPLPLAPIARGVGIFLAMIALGTMLFPWGSRTRSRDGQGTSITVEQTGVQMLYGGKTVRESGNTKSSELAHVEEEVRPHQPFVPRLILGFPLCLVLAIGSLALLDRASRWRWAATWAALAVVLVLLQLFTDLPTDRGRDFLSRYSSEAMWVGIAAAFLLVMLSIWPVNPAPEANANAWAVAAPLLLGVAVLYATAFFLTAVSFEEPNRDSSSHSRVIAAEGEHSGRDAFEKAYIINMQCWYANPVGWMAWLLVICRRWLWATAAASLAFWLALTHVVYAKLDDGTHGATWGYYLWATSFLVLALGSLAGWFMTRRLPTRSRLGLAGGGD